MFTGLVILHRTTRQPFDLHTDDVVLWKTCLRQLLFAYRPHDLEKMIQPGDEIYRDHRAYQFCLEVICGLHSPLVGETEVLGQFRACFKQQLREITWAGLLQKWVQVWLTDAKRLRDEFLLNLGSQSYGSVARRYLKSFSHISIVGSGQLTRDILPWILKDKIQVEIISRNSEVLHELKQSYPEVQGSLLSHWHRRKPEAAAKALVIAAPLRAQELQALVAGFDLILDLRGEASNDPLQASLPVVALNEVFAQVSATQTQAQIQGERARCRIAEMVEARQQRVENRPFGWDDLCA